MYAGDDTLCMLAVMESVEMQVHRLDEATGGLLLVAKTRLGLQGLSSSFEQRQVLHSSMLTPLLCLPRPRESSLMLPLPLPMTAQSGKRIQSLHADARSVIAHNS